MYIIIKCLTSRIASNIYVCVCVCVCARARALECVWGGYVLTRACVCVCVCVRERERDSGSKKSRGCLSV